MVTQRAAQWWYELLDMFGAFNHEVRNGAEKPGYRLLVDDPLVNFDRWEWHEPWGDTRGITTYAPEQREARNGNHPARLRLDFGLGGYRAGMIYSRQGYQYGCFEVRAKLPAFPVASAFWMESPPGVPYHEIDVAEFAPANGHGVIDFAYHRAVNDQWTSPFITKLTLGAGWHTRWHTYTLHWGPRCLTFMVDNRPLYLWPWGGPRVPLHPLLHLEADANYRPGQVPVWMEIDYVRIWEAA